MNYSKPSNVDLQHHRLFGVKALLAVHSQAHVDDSDLLWGQSCDRCPIVSQ